jgi:P-type Ca2+ transporter type 2C
MTLAGLPTPLTAIQILWLNLITDGAPALALAMEKGDPDNMLRPPRPKGEPIVNTTMQLGIFIQTITQTGATLSAFSIGLMWGVQALGHGVQQGINPLMYLFNIDWRSIEPEVLLTARTMAFATLSLAELFRAYTVRSERVSLFRLGVFSNRFMQYAVGLSTALLLIVCNVPFLQPIFNTHFLGAHEWGVVVGLALIPAVSEEITKFYMRYQSRGHCRLMAHA